MNADKKTQTELQVCATTGEPAESRLPARVPTLQFLRQIGPLRQCVPSSSAKFLANTTVCFGHPAALIGREDFMKRSLQLIWTFCLLGFAAQAGKVSPDFKVTDPKAMVKVVVQFSVPPTASTLGALNGKGAAAQKIFKHFPKTMVFTVPQCVVPFIAQIPGVK